MLSCPVTPAGDLEIHCYDDYINIKLHQRHQKRFFLIAFHQLLKDVTFSMSEHIVQIKGGGLGLILWFNRANRCLLMKKVQNFSRSVCCNSLLQQCLGQIEVSLWWLGNPFFGIFLALLLNFEQFEEELLCMRAHLSCGPGNDDPLDHFPVFAVNHKGYLVQELP